MKMAGMMPAIFFCEGTQINACGEAGECYAASPPIL